MRRIIAALAAAGGLLAAGCGPGGEAGADTAAKREASMLAFAECMRSHGVDVPDPTTDEDGHLVMRAPARISREGPEDGSKERTAQRACQKHLAGSLREFTPEQRAEMQDKMVSFAECMRAKGVDMPDPDFSEAPGGAAGFRQRIRAGGVNPSDERFQTASKACNKEVFGGKGGPGGAVFFAPAGRENN